MIGEEAAMLRAVLVAVHVTAGVAGLVAGLAAIPPARPTGLRLRVRQAYLPCLAVLLLALFALVGVDSPRLESGGRVAFAGLSGLGLVMAYRIVRAGREEARKAPGWQRRYLGHVYFTYISLWIGFLIIAALRLPLPQVAAPLVGIGTLVLGNLLVSAYRQRLPQDGRDETTTPHATAAPS
jgi:hypothetical protein